MVWGFNVFLARFGVSTPVTRQVPPFLTGIFGNFGPFFVKKSIFLGFFAIFCGGRLSRSKSPFFSSDFFQMGGGDLSIRHTVLNFTLLHLHPVLCKNYKQLIVPYNTRFLWYISAKFREYPYFFFLKFMQF